MSQLRLIIGNQKYSSWSFRPWLLLKTAQIPFTQTKILIRKADTAGQIRRFSPAGRVPVLLDGKIAVWESLAICEHLAERFPKKKLWPSEAGAKAVARSISHEMHAGFAGLRTHLPCHFLARYRDFKVAPEAQEDIDRIVQIWTDCRKRWGKGGPFLFGRFSVADAMYAPVVFRFLAYGVRVNQVCQKYMRAVEDLPASREWVEAARHETDTIPAYENRGTLVESKRA